jgi:polysaccharide chain length determinant protein (PEP-CTERM system associated)
MLPGKKFSPDDIVKILWRRKGLIAIPPLVFGFAALLVSRSLDDLYESDTLIQVVPQRVPDRFVPSAVNTDIEDRLKAIKQQILSRTRLEQMIVDLNLYPNFRGKRPMEDIVEIMRNAVEVELAARPGRRAEEQIDSFKVKFTYRDPKVCADVVTRLAQWFVDENSRLRSAQAETTNQFLETQLADARARLEAQEKKLEEFRQRHAGSLPTELQTNMQAIQTTQLQLQNQVESIARDKDRKLMLERLYNDAVNDLRTLQATPPPTAAGTQGPLAAESLPAGASPRQRLEAAKADLARLEMRLKPEHPDVIRAKRIIADLEAKVAAEPPAQAAANPTTTVGRTPDEQQRRERVQNMKAEIESLDRQIRFKETEEARLRGEIANFQGRLAAVPAVESEFTALNRDYQTINDTYKQLLTRSEESKMSKNLEQRQISEQFKVLDAPRVPDRPVGARRIQVNAGGLVAGLLLGIGLAGLLEFVDSTFRSESDVVSALSLPVLATVPYVPTPADVARARSQTAMTAIAAAAATVVAGGVFWYLQLWKFLH